MDIKKLMRPNILALAPYSTARDEYQGGEIGVFLDANESPYETGFNRYPDPHLSIIREKLASIKGVAKENVFVGNGSDEAIDLIFRIFCAPAKDNCVTITPSYGMYKVSAAINDVEVREVLLSENYELEADKILAACDSNSKVIMLCSPNNPSGNQLSREEITKIVENFGGIVVIDEAYIDFCPKGSSFVSSLSSIPNVIVLQTLSKAWGMAGLRLGMAIGSEEIIAVMNNVKYPYNINILAQQKVAELLENQDLIQSQCAEIVEQRAVVMAAFKKNPNIEKVFESDANFILIKVADSTALYNYLVADGIIVRNRTSVTGCKNTLRVSIGTKEENIKLLKSIDNYEW